MDPPQEEGPSLSTHVGPIDPPEDRCAIPTFHDDDQLDEFEVEGLLMTRMYNHRSSIGAGRNKARISNQSSHMVATGMTICSDACNPHNRARSAIIVLFAALLLVLLFTREDEWAWQKIHLGDRDAKTNKQNVDPLSELTPKQRHALMTLIYGTWGFYDGAADERPQEPYLTVEKAGMYIDIKGDDFPEKSWQVDAVYVNHFLDAAVKLVTRGQKAIFSTYHGHGIVNITVDEIDGEVYGEVENQDKRLTQRLDMFRLEEVDLSSVTTVQELQEQYPHWQVRGGWTTPRSMDGLERRFMHAMMTESTFTIVITGNWQNMGYGGNHGWQSMAGVLDHLLSGLFEKLGMKLIVRAIGLPPKVGLSSEEQAEMRLGGRSTLESSLGWSSIYGSDVDMVVWDDYGSNSDNNARDLDNTGAELFDFFARQALLSGPTNVPFIWGGDFEVLRNLHEFADADVGQLGNAISGVPETIDQEQAATLTRSAQYLSCAPQMQAICQYEENIFESQCWDSSFKLTPPLPQTSKIPTISTAIGWRMHQLKGYTLGYNLLAALRDALDVWSEKTIYEGHPLADENWHMEEYFKNIQNKVVSLTEKNAPHCYQLNDKLKLPKRICNKKMQGRTEYTPRANPAETSLHNAVLSSSETLTASNGLETVFEDETWENPIATIENTVDALEVIQLEKDRRRVLDTTRWYKKRQLAVELGEGWEIHDSFLQLDCNGSYTPSSSCGRVFTSTCLMEGHHGSRGYISGNDQTGWLPMVIPSLEFGYVAMNLQIEDINNFPDSFSFQYSVDEKTFEWTKSEFIEKVQVFNGLGLITILDDETRKPDKDLKISVRVVGCNDNCQINISHLYWS